MDSGGSILYAVMREGMILTGLGTLAGLIGAAALTRLLAVLLFETSPTDAPTFAAISVVFLGVALVACLIPARQITTINPLNALGQDSATRRRH